MDKQEGLFDQARARTIDPETSHQAAASVVNIGLTRESILKVLRDHGPQTDTQIQKAYLDLWRGEARIGGCMPLASPSGLRSRRAELVKMGFVEAAGGHNSDGTPWGIFGKTSSGRNCTIWRLVKK